jgi:hypothetical protein
MIYNREIQYQTYSLLTPTYLFIVSQNILYSPLVFVNWPVASGRTYGIHPCLCYFSVMIDSKYFPNSAFQKCSPWENTCSKMGELILLMLLLRNVKIKIYKIITVIVLRVVLQGLKPGVSPYRENIGWECLKIECWREYLRLREGIMEVRRKSHEERHNLYSWPSIIMVIRWRSIDKAGHVANMKEMEMHTKF